MACCSHIEKGLDNSLCYNCLNPMKPRLIMAEPQGKPMISVNNVLIGDHGLNHKELIVAASYIVDSKFTFVVFPNGMKLHPSVL